MEKQIEKVLSNVMAKHELKAEVDQDCGKNKLERMHNGKCLVKHELGIIQINRKQVIKHDRDMVNVK